jgi:hypothetical protein
MKRLLFLIPSFLCLYACGVQNIRPDSPPQLQADSAILLLGMTPKWRIQLFRGEVENDAWSISGLAAAEVNTVPENGYVIVKTKPTALSEVMGVSRVFPSFMPYMPCKGSKAPTFALMAGAVNYVGDLDFEVINGELRWSYSTNVEKAKQFLAANYPGYVSAFESGSIVARGTKGSVCGGSL